MCIRDSWDRLQRFPHCFEVAEKQRALHSLKLDGTVDDTAPAPTPLTHVKHADGSVHIGLLQQFVDYMVLTPEVFEFLAHAFRARVEGQRTCLLRTDQLRRSHISPFMKWKPRQKEPTALPEWTYVPYLSTSKLWGLYALHKDSAGQFALHCYLPSHADPRAFDWATSYLCRTFRIAAPQTTHSTNADLGDCTLFWYLYAALLQKDLEDTAELERTFLTSCQGFVQDLLESAAEHQEEYCER